MKVSDHLKVVRALIDTPNKWTQRTDARDEDGTPVSIYNPDVACFCSLGAVYRAASDLQSAYHSSVGWKDLVDVSLRAINSVIGVRGLAAFNDTHTHAEVMEAWDRAIELEETGEQLREATASVFSVAFKAGKLACELGANAADNPNAPETAAHNWWHIGFREALDEKEDK